MQTGTETNIHGVTNITIYKADKLDREGTPFYVRKIVIEARGREIIFTAFSDDVETLSISL